MQSLPIIIAVFVAAAAIIAVLFWRIKPQSAANLEAVDKRIAEEAGRAQSLQAKLDAGEATLRDALATAAAAKATMEAANARAGVAEANAEQAKADLTALQRKYQDAEPLVATATEQKKAAEDARAEVVQRYDDLTIRYNVLQAESNELKPVVAKASAERNAMEEAKKSVENRLQELHEKYDALLASHENALQETAVSKLAAETLLVNQDKLCHEVEGLQSSLTEERAERVKAVTKQQSDEASASRFKVISQEILDKTLEEAKRGMGELAATLQRTSDAGLEKHAEKVALTLEPLQNKLQSYNEAIDSMKEASYTTFGSLTNQITELQKAEYSLGEHARALTRALSSTPKYRGNYGELALTRLVESVGMRERCHFEPQAGRDTEDGRKIPDMIVSLPGGQKVVIDAKAVLNACAEAHEAEDKVERERLFKQHCTNVRSRVLELAAKNYFANHPGAVEAVILFLPSENLYITAMEHDPDLTDYAASRRVIICGPNSLIMLLTVASHLWRQASIEKEAQDIQKCGEKIFKAACDFADKFVGIGRKIQSLELEYNGAVATFEGRLLPAGKQMSNFEAVSRSQEVSDIVPVKSDIRELREATKQLIASTQKLPGLVVGDEPAELSFEIGEDQ